MSTKIALTLARLFTCEMANGRKIRLAMILACSKIRPSLQFSLIPMSFVVASKVKEVLKKNGMMSAGDFADACSAMLEEACKKAAARAKGNGRKTVRPVDL